MARRVPMQNLRDHRPGDIFGSMVDVARKRVTYAEYIAIANDSPVKYEYIAGEIVAMSGGTIAHGRLIGRVTDVLNRALDGTRCVVLPSDLRVRIRSAERSTYPDLHVVCGEIERDPDDDHAIVNPAVIVEILSDSTEDSDRTEKFAAYRRLRSLREYVLVSQRERRVEVYRRDSRRWYLDEYGPGERLALGSLAIELAIELAVDELYIDRIGPIVG
jgi:Uma2 family endonuclease